MKNNLILEFNKKFRNIFIMSGLLITTITKSFFFGDTQPGVREHKRVGNHCFNKFLCFLMKNCLLIFLCQLFFGRFKRK